jgi:hypothetical protein
MITKHPVTGDILFNVKETAAYLSDHGLPTSTHSLDSDRSKGVGPKFLKIGKMVYYREPTLRDYLLSQHSVTICYPNTP